MTELNTPSQGIVKRSDRIMGGSLLFVALRCILQYIVLPFALPLFGLTSTLSVGISLTLELIAVAMIAFNIIALWHTSWRWRYLALSVIFFAIIGTFGYMDLKILFGW